jgi:hypothetical protein
MSEFNKTIEASLRRQIKELRVENERYKIALKFITGTAETIADAEKVAYNALWANP